MPISEFRAFTPLNRISVTNLQRFRQSVATTSTNIGFLGDTSIFQYFAVRNDGLVPIYISFNEPAVVGQGVLVASGAIVKLQPPSNNVTVNAIANGSQNANVFVVYQLK